MSAYAVDSMQGVRNVPATTSFRSSPYCHKPLMITLSQLLQFALT